ncbi:hypothetical protein [Microtetraspora fusca]|uniref:Uncharacterized protein n=1 Tax=Microtetraspora fusca TaxID=1997 RepID=A0ABW6V9D1_MICFU|nr:hypothetical protein [Microtetraspora fusca]
MLNDVGPAVEKHVIQGGTGTAFTRLLGVIALAGVAVLVYLIVVIAAARKASVLGATGGR